MNVWSYWEGACPEYIDVCISSLRNTCPTFVLVTPKNMHEYLSDKTIHSNYLKLDQPALKADCIRAALLAEHGGFWYDADTVGFKNPLLLIKKYDYVSALYTSWINPPFRVLNGYIYIQKDHIIARQWLDAINKVLHDDFKSASWCSLGEQLLTTILPYELTAVHVHRSTFLPIDIDSDVPTFFTSKDYKDYITKHTVCYGLNHSWFMYHRKKDMLIPRSEWNKSPLLIHRLLASVA